MKKAHIFACSLIIVVSIVIYLNSLSVPFQFDDLKNILKNEDIRIEKINRTSIRRLVFSDTGEYYPRGIVNLSFALNYYFGKYNVLGYHLINIAVHIIAGITLYFFLYLTLILVLVSSNPPITQSPDYGAPITNCQSTGYPLSNPGAPLPASDCLASSTRALLVSLLWLTNPIQIQAVTYVVQRFTSMATMFYLLALVFYLKARLFKGHFFTLRFLLPAFASLFFALLSLGSKQIAISLPLIIIIYEILFFGALGKQSRKKSFVYFLLLILFFVIFLISMLRGGIGAPGGLNLIRVTQVFPVIIYFLTLLLFPLPGRLTLDYDFVSFPAITTIFSILSVFGIVFIAWRLIIRKKLLVPFFIFWFFLNFLPQSLYRAITGWDLAFEHWLYLSSIGFAAVYVLAAEEISGKATILIQKIGKRRLNFNLCKVCLPALFIILIILQSFWTIRRNDDWKDPVSLWMDTVMKAPNNPRAHTNLGAAFLDKGEVDQAINSLQNALKVGWFSGIGVSVKTNYYLARAYQQKGWDGKAIEQLEIAIDNQSPFDSLEPGALFHLADLYAEEKLYEKAIATYQKIIKMRGGSENAYLHLANCYQLSGLDKEAVEAYNKVFYFNPRSYEAYYNLGMLYLRQGKKKEAMAEFDKAAKIGNSLNVH